MDRHKPDMRDACLEDQIGSVVLVEAGKELLHLPLEPARRWRFVVHPLASHGTRDHLHRAGLVRAPVAHRNLCHAAAARREQCRVPRGDKEQGFGILLSPRRLVLGELHRYNSRHKAVSRRSPATALGGCP